MYILWIVLLIQNHLQVETLSSYCSNGQPVFSGEEIYVNSTDFINNGKNDYLVTFWIHEVTPVTAGLEGSVNGMFCCDDCTTAYYFTTDSTHDNATYILNRTKAVCSLGVGSFVDLSMNCSANDYYANITMCIRLPVLWNKYLGNCSNDITHVASSHGCLPLSRDLLVYINAVPRGLTCQLQDNYYYTTPGYWLSGSIMPFIIM